MLFVVVLIIALFAFVAANVVIVPQAKAYVVERLGAYSATWGTGLHIKIPFIERIAKKISLKEQVVDFPPQAVITKDNVTMQIDSIVYMQFTDPRLLTYGVENPLNAIENLTATTLRNIIGEMELDATLASRDVINSRMRSILDEATDAWGIKVNRIEIRDITPPRQIMESMEKQMRAERERRESILQAEGQKQSEILIAEGKKQAAILQADADKQAAILRAQGDKEARIMAAEAEAVAILKVQDATAQGLERIKQVQADDGLVRLRSIEALEKMADGKATKIIIPSSLQGSAGTLAGLVETIAPPAESAS